MTNPFETPKPRGLQAKVAAETTTAEAEASVAAEPRFYYFMCSLAARVQTSDRVEGTDTVTYLDNVFVNVLLESVSPQLIKRDINRVVSMGMQQTELQGIPAKSIVGMAIMQIAPLSYTDRSTFFATDPAAPAVTEEISLTTMAPKGTA